MVNPAKRSDSSLVAKDRNQINAHSDLPLTAAQDTGKTAVPGTRLNPWSRQIRHCLSQHSFVERCVPDDGGLVGWAAADAVVGMIPIPTQKNFHGCPAVGFDGHRGDIPSGDRHSAP